MSELTHHPPGLHHRCWAEVDLDALRQNLLWIRHRAGPAVKVMTVVKADAYGHGLRQIAALLMQSGTDIFGVANLTEAAHIRGVGKGWPILMLGACLPHEQEMAVHDEIMVTISSLEEARRMASIAQQMDRTASVHLKVDTGMSRLGATPKEALTIARRIRTLSRVRLVGLYTHYASVEDDPRFSRQQRARFAEVVRFIAELGLPLDFIHANNSGGLLFEPDALYNTIRPGLIVYGVIPPGRRSLAHPLAREVMPALSWKAHVSLIKKVPAGTSISYGRTFITPRPMRLATITAGYGDGYLRSGSNRSHVLIRERPCRVVGRITMDQLMADVTAVPRARVGDEVVLLGRQGPASITAGDLARWTGTVPWEVLTNITYRVPRIYRGSQAA